MKRLLSSLLRSEYRRLQLSVGGYWYIFFTMVLGIVAISSNNNVIYLLESMLLSALILSGLVSEFSVGNTEITWKLNQGKVGERCTDIIELKNESIFPLFCLEIGEWKANHFTSLGVVLFLGPGEKKQLYIPRHFQERGIYKWESFSVATAFPFGLAKKIRITSAGQRIIWPRGRGEFNSSSRAKWRPEGEPEFVSGELKELGPLEDVTWVHWPTSIKNGKLLARHRKNQKIVEEIKLKYCDPSPELEERISRAVEELRRASHEAILVIESQGRTRRIAGFKRAMDTLALMPKQEPVALMPKQESAASMPKQDENPVERRGVA